MALKSGTFHLKGHTGLQIDHAVDEYGELGITFYGGLLVRSGQRYDQYIEHLRELEAIAGGQGISHVHCHLEYLGEVLSRAQHAIYRMLGAMRRNGKAVTVYATGEHPEQLEHLRMAKLFVNGLSKEPGPQVKLVEIRRAS